VVSEAVGEGDFYGDMFGEDLVQLVGAGSTVLS
jgi:hypothetical protein